MSRLRLCEAMIALFRLYCRPGALTLNQMAVEIVRIQCRRVLTSVTTRAVIARSGILSGYQFQDGTGVQY
jgi:hypothetical protein